MKYLRHPALSFYLVGCLVLAGIGALAYHEGARSPSRSEAARVPSLASQVMVLRERVPDLVGFIGHPSAMASWGRSEAATATRDAASRVAAVGHQDNISRAFLALARDSSSLGAGGRDGRQAVALVANDTDVLAALVATEPLGAFTR